MKQKGFSLPKAILLIEGQLNISLTGIQYEDGSRLKFNINGSYDGFVELNQSGIVIECKHSDPDIIQPF